MATLKEQALLERVGQLTVSYEDRIADLRVELTQTIAQLEELRGQVRPVENPSEVLEGTVVQ